MAPTKEAGGKPAATTLIAGPYGVLCNVMARTRRMLRRFFIGCIPSASSIGKLGCK